MYYKVLKDKCGLIQRLVYEKNDFKSLQILRMMILQLLNLNWNIA